MKDSDYIVVRDKCTNYDDSSLTYCKTIEFYDEESSERKVISEELDGTVEDTNPNAPDGEYVTYKANELYVDDVTYGKEAGRVKTTMHIRVVYKYEEDRG